MRSGKPGYGLADDGPDPWEECTTLEEAKAEGAPLRYAHGVLIWSGEHSLWWMANRAGYTPIRAEAGVYAPLDALHVTRHCGPEKEIEFYPAGADA